MGSAKPPFSFFANPNLMRYVFTGDEKAENIMRLGKYWALQPHGVEWEFVVEELIRQFLSNPPTAEEMIILTGEGRPVFLLSRDKIPMEEVIKRTGATPAMLLNYDYVRLKVFEGNEHLPKPTVNIWGRA